MTNSSASATTHLGADSPDIPRSRRVLFRTLRSGFGKGGDKDHLQAVLMRLSETAWAPLRPVYGGKYARIRERAERPTMQPQRHLENMSMVVLAVNTRVAHDETRPFDFSWILERQNDVNPGPRCTRASVGLHGRGTYEPISRLVSDSLLAGAVRLRGRRNSGS